MITNHIRKFRIRAGITAIELASRIGCSRQYLSLVESGKETPSKSLLSKIATELRLSEGEAKKLGVGVISYSGIANQNEVSNSEREDKVIGLTQPNLPGQSMNIEVPNNLIVAYTDFISMTWNQYGITLDFGQKMGPTNKVNIVSRVGMSREHASDLLRLLDTELKKMKK